MAVASRRRASFRAATPIKIWFQNRRTKWKRKYTNDLELLAQQYYASMGLLAPRPMVIGDRLWLFNPAVGHPNQHTVAQAGYSTPPPLALSFPAPAGGDRGFLLGERAALNPQLLLAGAFPPIAGTHPGLSGAHQGLSGSHSGFSGTQSTHADINGTQALLRGSQVMPPEFSGSHSNFSGLRGSQSTPSELSGAQIGSQETISELNGSQSSQGTQMAVTPSAIVSATRVNATNLSPNVTIHSLSNANTGPNDARDPLKVSGQLQLTSTDVCRISGDAVRGAGNAEPLNEPIL
ncbi:uncharacterized protein LOC125178306 [Hyalella azteca]|uniref:Uncharacterized protein LOC125178306 n=1 Tax=Hyalella azteca TaxID=294128 RepID=A0A979FL07_HYAAZ|nr:uncharacterized protein LOC125178306 [Hyalella azteca]